MKRFTGKCLNCGKTTPQKEQRRGLCNRCYLAEYHDREIGSSCEVCNLGDLRMLVRRKMIDGHYHTLCGNCSVLWGRRKIAIDDLRAELFADDRRNGDRRSNGVRRTYLQREGVDPRLWDRDDSPERRDDDRRSPVA